MEPLDAGAWLLYGPFPRGSQVDPTPELGKRLAPSNYSVADLRSDRATALETTRQVAEIFSGHPPPGAVNPEHATRLAKLRA
jgi:hypothetical protein